VAVNDLDELAAYIQKDSPQAAMRFLEAAQATFEALAQTFHYGVVLGFPLITGGIRETAFEEIRFRVEPDPCFVGHKSSPAFGLSVKQAVTKSVSRQFVVHVPILFPRRRVALVKRRSSS
jgi:hypothetical protein